MRKILLFLSILLVGMPSTLVAQEFALLTGKIKDGVLDVYLNTEGFSPFISVEDFEAIMVERFAQVNQIATSSARVNYKGRTTLPCDDLKDGVVAYCFKSEQDTLGYNAFSWGKASGGLLTDARTYINSGKNFSKRSLKWLALHELGHILGLDDYHLEKSIMGGTPTSYSDILTEYDIAALTYLYPFDLDKCEVTLSADFVLDLPYVWVGDEMYKATFQFNAVSNGFELQTIAIQDKPVSQCGYKFIGSTGAMHIASVWYDSKVESERGRYFLNLKFKPNSSASVLPAPLLFEIVSAGSISSH